MALASEGESLTFVQRGGACRRGARRRSALGRRDPRMLADGDPRLETVVYKSLDTPTLEAAMTATYPAPAANLPARTTSKAPKPRRTQETELAEPVGGWSGPVEARAPR